MEPVKEKASRFLLDTHVLLWWLFDDPKLSGPAHDVIQAPDNTILVSSASGWEIATKYRLGKLSHAGEAAHNLPSLLRKSRIDVLPITMEHALAAGAFSGPHRDPFDRMLIAQGQIEGLPIVTSDPVFKQYSVEL
ncbi:MAG: type II toxin-antitoxin system VapC family toxin, partial [Proteobacteria bacterium]|nr:type II toxin-antitoxin system VapC family toxin [Pseudomonadota bacterium]